VGFVAEKLAEGRYCVSSTCQCRTTNAPYQLIIDRSYRTLEMCF